jgi:hypothetical protein
MGNKVEDPSLEMTDQVNQQHNHQEHFFDGISPESKGLSRSNHQHLGYIDGLDNKDLSHVSP